MTRWIIVAILLAGCPMRDRWVEGTNMLAMDYPAYRAECTAVPAAEMAQLSQIWHTVVRVARETGLMTGQPNSKVRLCITDKAFPCGPWPVAVGCAGSNAILVSRFFPNGKKTPFASLAAEEILKHFIVSSRTKIPWDTEEFGPDGIMENELFLRTLEKIRTVVNGG